MPNMPTQSSPPSKRVRPIGVPAPGIAVSAEDVHNLLTQLAEGVNHQNGRIEVLERETKMIADALGTVGRHCQASSTELHGHLASSSADLGKAIQAVDAALRATIEAAQERFAEFQRDAKELMARTDQGVTQLSFRSQEHERALNELNSKVTVVEAQQWVPRADPAPSPGATGATSQPVYYHMGTPAKGTTEPQASAAAAPAAAAAPTEWQQSQAWAGWQHGSQQWAPHPGPADGFDPWRRGPTSPNPGGPADPWPLPAGNWPVLQYGGKYSLFDTKFGQDVRNQYDGGKKGEEWKAGMRTYLIGVHPPMRQLLTWAERREQNPITPETLETLKCWMDEDPVMIGHFLWAFLGVNLTGAALAIHANCGESNGFEVWRRIHQSIFSRAERRQDELYTKIHNPRAAANAQDVAAALEEWDTDQRRYCMGKGVPLRDDELRNLVMKLVPANIRDQLVYKRQEPWSWEQLKDWIREHARLHAVYGKPSSVHLAEPVNAISDEFMEQTEGWEWEDQVAELDIKGDAQMLLALTNKRLSWQQNKGRRLPKGKAKGKDGGGKGKGKDDKAGKGRGPTTQDGKPLCTNCNQVGHYKDGCPSEKVDASQRKCFRCNKPGHVSSQCTSGLPLKSVEEENAVTMSMEVDDGPWEEVLEGNRYPHMAEHMTRFEHDTTFQVFEDDSDLEEILDGLDSKSDDAGDEEQGDAVWLDDADEDLMRSSNPLSPCCLLACTSRGRHCLMDMLSNITVDLEQEEEKPEPPPSVACTPPRASKKHRRRFKPMCSGCECDEHALESEEAPECAKDTESPENLNDEVVEWTEYVGRTHAEIWEKVEDDEVMHQPTIDAFGVRGEMTFPADEASSAETPKVLSKDCWVQTELRREEVGVQTEAVDPEPIFYDCMEEWEVLMLCDSLEEYEKLMHEIETEEYNTDENLDESMRDSRNYPDGNLCVLEGEAYDEVNVAQSCEGSMQRIEMALDSGAGEHVASKSIAPAYTISESAGSRAGQHFVAAGGARIRNEGQFTLRLRSGGLGRHEGRDITSTFQVAKVTRPLWSVGRICDEGFDVKFSKESAVVQTKEGKDVCKFQRKGGLYVAELHLKPEPKPSEPFTRRGT